MPPGPIGVHNVSIVINTSMVSVLFGFESQFRKSRRLEPDRLIGGVFIILRSFNT